MTVWKYRIQNQNYAQNSISFSRTGTDTIHTTHTGVHIQNYMDIYTHGHISYTPHTRLNTAKPHTFTQRHTYINTHTHKPHNDI